MQFSDLSKHFGIIGNTVTDLQSRRKQMLNDLSEIIAINSVEAERSAADAPFGAELRNALDWFLNKASHYGLKVGENGGYYGWAEYGDPESPLIGIICHIDIVPAGSGWEGDPFKMRSENGKVYGRGAADDKGPLVAALHVLKKLKDDKTKLKHRVRLIVGCNEETGSLCLKKYAAEGEIPVVSLTPDSDFPVINSEKGILHTDAELIPDEIFLNNVIELSAGERANVVPGSAYFIIKRDGTIYETLKKTDPQLTADVFRTPAITEKLVEIGAEAEDFGIEHSDRGIKITARGVAGHAMDPDKADNALWKIWAFLRAYAPESEFISRIYDNFCRKDCAKTIGAYKEDEKSGRLTMNMGVARYEGSKLTIKFDFRLPITADPDSTEAALKSALPGEAVIKRARFADNLYIDESSPLIKTLLSVYAEETGEKNPKPIQTGGGTYARELPNAVAFGPTFPGAETNIHNADENIEVAHLYKLYDIYLKAIKALDTLY